MYFYLVAPKFALYSMGRMRWRVSHDGPGWSGSSVGRTKSKAKYELWEAESRSTVCLTLFSVNIRLVSSQAIMPYSFSYYYEKGRMTKLHGKRYAYKFNIDVIKRKAFENLTFLFFTYWSVSVHTPCSGTGWATKIKCFILTLIFIFCRAYTQYHVRQRRNNYC